MTHAFEVRAETTVRATPDQVWEAIASSTGMDGWFMGDNDVEPELGGAVRTRLPGFTMSSTITTFEPPHRFVTTSPGRDDGRLDVFSFEIEGRAGGSTSIRLVHSGFLPGDDWEGGPHDHPDRRLELRPVPADGRSPGRGDAGRPDRGPRRPGAQRRPGRPGSCDQAVRPGLNPCASASAAGARRSIGLYPLGLPSTAYSPP